MIGVTGRRSSISQEFVSICDDWCTFSKIEDMRLDLNRYLICHGVLHGLAIADMSDDQIRETMDVNFIHTVRFLDRLFAENDHAKVCVIGSESGIKGSYDTAYAASKAALHLYIETKQLAHANQHLVCVAPTIIADSGMTERRQDYDETMKRGSQRRIGRWLSASEVARVCKMAMNEPGLCNTVIRMNGGW